MLAVVPLPLRIAQAVISVIVLLALAVFWRDVFRWKTGRPRVQLAILLLLVVALLVSIAILIVAL